MALILHDYQRQAVDFLHGRKRAGLLLDMGLGKTAISLSALTPDHLPVLVTAPKRVAEHVWKEEVRLWRPDLTIRVAAGSPAQRQAALTGDADIIVIGRDNLADAVPHAKRFRTFIMDELSSFKNRGSARWKSAKKITKDMEHVFGLTGTPSPNGMLDLWPQVYLLDNGESLGTTIGGYRERYFTPGRRLPNGIVSSWDIRPGAAGRIHRLLETTCLSMSTEGRVDLPPTTFNNVEVHLGSLAKRIYKDMKNDLVADLDMLGGEIHSATNAAVLSSKLSQITAGFMYVDDADLRGRESQEIHSEKVKAVMEIVEGTGSPVLVFYRFQKELEMLQRAMPVQGHTMDEDNIVERWNKGEIPVLFAHPASAGHGLNLQRGGHTAIWTTLPWSLEEYQQANKRLARQGQQHPVVIHHLLVPRTVDGAILARLQEKKDVQDALLDHLESPI